jgi:hypothetical protein
VGLVSGGTEVAGLVSRGRGLVRLRWHQDGLKGASHAGVAGVLLLMLQHRGI